MTNLVSAVMSDEAREAAKQKISEVKELLPFLIALPVEQKTRKRVMGQKSVEYVNLGLRGANNFGQHLPQTFNAEEFSKDVALVSRLWELRVPLASLLESIDDTIFAASSDAMKMTDEIYSFLKVAAKKDASVKALVDEMSKRFKQSAKKKDEKTAGEA